MGIARSTLFNWLKSETPPPAKHWQRIAGALHTSVPYLVSGALGGPEKPDVVQVAEGSASRVPLPGDYPMRITPGHEPTAREPTRAQIAAYVERYLDQAQRTPGGLGHAWFQIRKHLDLAELKRMEELP